MRKREITMLAMAIASLIIAAYFYPTMPAQVASHWNSAGIVNGYIGKFWGTFLIPIVILGLFVLFVAIPRIDPLKANIEAFRNY